MHTSSPVPPAAARAAGVLLHPTSLPGSYGIGDFGDELIVFLDWAASAGFKVWQVLPLNPPGYGESPYGCLSSFAGSPLMISPQRLLQDGLLNAEFVAQIPHFDDRNVEFARVAELKFRILRESWRLFNEGSHELRDAYESFVEGEDEWLDDYALYMALKDQAGGGAWWSWDPKLARRDAKAIARALRDLADDIAFWKYVQWIFFRQWSAVRDAAHARGIRIMGDVPIYVAGDSADVWGNRELFQLDENDYPTVVAGVPPDYFSATGQRWGNPLYRWDVMREDNYRWWVARVKTNLRLADVVRLDHFRGFAAYWEVPASETTAVHGRWMPGPGMALFDAIRDELGELPLVAEDLGFITQDVHDLRHAAGLPGMRILQFGFATIDSTHLPHRFEPRTVVYTGTHDNDTARGWFESAPDLERDNARAYLGCTGPDIAATLIRAAYTSVAELAIVPVQDILDLGSDARMNTPGASHGNWSWRMRAGELTREHAERMRRLAEVTARL